MKSSLKNIELLNLEQSRRQISENLQNYWLYKKKMIRLTGKVMASVERLEGLFLKAKVARYWAIYFFA